MAKNTTTKNKKKAAPRDMFGGGRIKAGDTYRAKAFGKEFVAKIGKKSITYTVNGGVPKTCQHLSEIVAAELPRSEFSHHHSGWSLFGLMPAQIAARAAREEKRKEKAAKKTVKKASKAPAAKKGKKAPAAPTKRRKAAKASKKASPRRKRASA